MPHIISQANSMDNILKYTAIKKSPLFDELSEESLEALFNIAEEIELLANSPVFKEKDISDGLYIIQSGQVKIISNQQQISKLSDNDYFGELAFLSDQHRTSTAITISDCRLIYIDKFEFDTITNEIPEILKVMLKQLILQL